MLPDSSYVEVPDNVPHDQARSDILKKFPQFAPKTSILGNVGEAVKGVGAGAAGTLLDIPEGLADIAGYAGADTSGIKGLLGKARAGVESALGPKPGYEESVGRQLGTAAGSILPYFLPVAGEEALATRLGAGAGKAIARVAAPGAMGALSQGAAGASEAEQAGATKGQQAGAFAGNAASGALFAAIPTLRVLGHTPLGAENALANYIARSVETGAFGAGIGAIGKATDNAIARYTYDPKRTITDGMAAGAGLTGAGAGIANALVEAITQGRAAWHDYGPEQRKAYDNQLKQALKDRGLPQAIGLLEYHPEPIVTPPPPKLLPPPEHPLPETPLADLPSALGFGPKPGSKAMETVRAAREALGQTPIETSVPPEQAPPAETSGKITNLPGRKMLNAARATPLQEAEIPNRQMGPQETPPPEPSPELPLQPKPAPVDVKPPDPAVVERQKKANAFIDDRLNRLAASGAQGAESAGSLRTLLQQSHWTPDQLYAAFKSSETISKMLGRTSDPYGLKFLDRMIRPDSEGKPQEVLGSFTPPTEATKGLVQLSLSPKFLDIANQTAYHEGFHALKSIMTEHDPATVRALDSSFQDGMTIDQVSGPIRRTLERTKVPGQAKTYWDLLASQAGSNKLPAEEAQAYTFGALADAKAQGAKPTGLAAPAIRFLNFMSNLKERLGNGLRGDGYQSAEDIYGRAAQGQTIPEGVNPSPATAGQEKLSRAHHWEDNSENPAIPGGSATLDLVSRGGRYSGWSIVHDPEHGEWRALKFQPTLADAGRVAGSDKALRWKPAWEEEKLNNQPWPGTNFANHSPPFKTPDEAKDFAEFAATEKAEKYSKAPPEDSRIEALQNTHLGKEDDRSFFQKLIEPLREEIAGFAPRKYQEFFDSAHSTNLNIQELVKQGKKSEADLLAGTNAFKAMDFSRRSGSFAEASIAQLKPPVYEPRGTGAGGISYGDSLMNNQDIKAIAQGNLWRAFGTYYALPRDARMIAERPGYTSQLLPELNKQGMTHADAIKYYEQKYPFFASAKQAFDQGWFKPLTKFLVDTGHIDQATKAKWDASGDYVGFFKDLDQENQGRTLSGAQMEKPGATPTSKGRIGLKLEGHRAPDVDFLSGLNIATRATIQAGLKTAAARMAIGDALQLGMVRPIGKGAASRNPWAFTIRQTMPDGRVTDQGYEVIASPRVPRWQSQMFLDTMTAAEMSPGGGLMKALRVPAQILRTLTVQNPGFFLFTHPVREGAQSWIVYPGQTAPWHNAASGFISLLRNDEKAKEYLKYSGLPTFDFQKYTGSTGVGRAKAALEQGLPPNNWLQAAMGAIRQGWQKYEKLVEAGDQGTRLSIFNAEMAKHGNPFEASWQATNNAVNYSRHGTSQWLRQLTAMVPFMNARLQGMDVVTRALIRDTRQPMNLGNSWIKGGALMAMSGLLYAGVRDNEVYKNLPEEMRQLNWVVPVGDHVVTVPVPFEAGILFKTIPELTIRRMAGDDASADTWAGITRSLYDILRLDPFPQAVRPVVDVLSNRRALSGTPIVTQSQAGLPAGQQYNAQTTEAAKALAGLPIYPDFTTGKIGPASPAKVDYLLHAYLGTLGGAALALSDYGLKPLSKESPGFVSPSVNDIPVIGRIVRDPSLWSSPSIQHFYDVRTQADQLNQAYNSLMKEGRPEAARAAVAGQEKLLAARPIYDHMAQTLAKLNTQERLIRMLPPDRMDAEQKRQSLESIEATKRYLTNSLEPLRRSLQ